VVDVGPDLEPIAFVVRVVGDQVSEERPCRPPRLSGERSELGLVDLELTHDEAKDFADTKSTNASVSSMTRRIASRKSSPGRKERLWIRAR
jgi:hypothetical protein